MWYKYIQKRKEALSKINILESIAYDQADYIGMAEIRNEMVSRRIDAHINLLTWLAGQHEA
jgi:hypothetical protein